MKSTLLLLPAFLALAIFFATQNLNAQDAMASVAMSEHLPAPAPISKEEKDAKNLQLFDINAGQHAANFKDFAAHVAVHLVYPEPARENGIEGRVEVLLTISDEGKILGAKILKPLGSGCDEAALAFVREMPDWAPATNFGIPVKSKKVIGLDFRLR